MMIDKESSNDDFLFLGLDLDGLASKTHLASHAAKRVLLLRLASKP